MNRMTGCLAFALLAPTLATASGGAMNPEANAAAATPAPYFGDANGPDAIDPAAPAATSHYLRVPGSAFVPKGSSTSFDYASAGCISSGVAFGQFTTDLQLPQGATISYVRTYYYNMGVSNTVSTFLTSYDGAGNYVESTNFATTASAGYASDLGPGIAVAVDNLNNSYAMVVNIGAADANLRFCGVRILYTL